MNTEIHYVKAFENLSKNTNVVINYELHTIRQFKKNYEYVNKVFVQLGKSSAIIDLKNFKLVQSGRSVEKILSHELIAIHECYDGFSEIIVSSNSKQKFKVKFSSRDKSFRIIENSFDKTTASGEMISNKRVQIPSLDFTQGI
jgi:hypothetical protein